MVDPSGAAVVGAVAKLTRGNPPSSRETACGDGGQFAFTDVAAGPFQITITAPGFATQTLSGNLGPGESYTAGKITLPVATAVTEVRVGPAVAEAQIKEQEQQRVLGFVPNFYVSYIDSAVPLTPKQKFELAWKTTLDPMTLLLSGAAAGIQQADNDLGGYGQGAQGYGERFGAAYADTAISTFIGGAMLPSLLKQDPRYFYKGTGSVRSRILYAIGSAFICKGDNGHWQADYSGILGGLAAGGIANSYYPPRNRNSAAMVFETTLTGLGESAAENIFQEFIARKFTRTAVRRHRATPETKQSPKSTPNGF